MRYGFKSSRDAPKLRGGTGWGFAFATVAIFFSLLYPLAARGSLLLNRSRHSAEQK
jgi:hypothetical protein